MTFHNPYFLLLLPVACAVILWLLARGRTAGLRFSSGELLRGYPGSTRTLLRRFLPAARLLALVLCVIAFARPQRPLEESYVETEGIDIVLAIDASTSMLAEDFKIGGKRQNRITVVKQVVEEFIEARKSDRIGIVAFAGRAYIVSPLTLDYGWLMQNLARVEAGMMEDGTAIGSGIAASLNRLKDNPAKSKVVILLTDGRNNAGAMDPVTAAEAAKALGIKIYTIGAGSHGPVPYPMRDFFGNIVYQPLEVDLDEHTLEQIAETTGGAFFRATDTESLRQIYREIDAMERTEIEDEGYREHEELFWYFLIPALILLIMEMLLSETILRRLP